MSALIELRSYLFRYRVAIIGGFLFLILANIVALTQPYLIRLAVDSLQIGAGAGILLRYGLLIVALGWFRLCFRSSDAIFRLTFRGASSTNCAATCLSTSRSLNWTISSIIRSATWWLAPPTT